MNTKKCPQCKETKSYDQYWKSNTNKSGIQVYCIDCCKVKDKAQREYRKEHGPSIIKESKECQKCHNIKPISQFGKKRDASDGRLSYCKPCWLDITKKAQAKQRRR